ncbi:MAG: major facilitator superfamily 1 [Marmoricola sp.]|nr:major facilitator superfamily 1 [Marmoricola sp.]
MDPEPESTEPRRGDRFADLTGRGVTAGTRGVLAAGRATGRGLSSTFLFARRAARAEGAGDTGLSRLIELHAVSAAGDAAVTISLAGTIFFANPGGARGPVLLFLGLTMLPFAVVAPLLGPFLDRFSHGRRWAIGFTLAFRALMCLLMADAVASKSLALYPTALGTLIASKAYGVARAATVPRLLPEDQTLVKANSRIGLAGIVGAAVSAPLAALAASFGGQWSLRYGFVVFAGATILAVLLPAQADATAGEKRVGKREKFRLPATIVFALRCNVGLRMLSGFLTFFMAFVLTKNPFSSWHHSTEILLALVIGAAGLGNTVGIGLSSVLKRMNPAIVIVVGLLADAVVAVCAALFYGLLASIALGLTIGVAQAMGKLALDATIQRDVPENFRTSAFSRSETVLQLSWVLGGLLGVALPTSHPVLGLMLLAVLIVSWTVFVLLGRIRESRSPDLPVASDATREA